LSASPDQILCFFSSLKNLKKKKFGGGGGGGDNYCCKVRCVEGN